MTEHNSQTLDVGDGITVEFENSNGDIDARHGEVHKPASINEREDMVWFNAVSDGERVAYYVDENNGTFGIKTTRKIELGSVVDINASE